MADIDRWLREGRISRATKAFGEISPQCKSELGDNWGELALALAELGYAEPARLEAGRIALDETASAGAKRAAARALGHIQRYGQSGGDRKASLDVYERALNAERDGQHSAALSGYLDAWARFRPSPQALIRAGRVARHSSPASAQRFYDRGLEEYVRSTGKPVRASAWYVDDHMSLIFHARLLPGERSIALYLRDEYQVVDLTTFELLAAYSAGGMAYAFSEDGRFAANLTEESPPILEVVHAASGQRLASFKPEKTARYVAVNPSFTRIAVTGDGVVEVFDVEKARRSAHFDVPRFVSAKVEFLDDALLWGGFDHELAAWNVETGAKLWEQVLPGYPTHKLTQDGRFFYATAKAKRVEIGTVDLRTGQHKRVKSTGEVMFLKLLDPGSLAVSLLGKNVVYRADSLELISTTQLKDKRGWERVKRPTKPESRREVFVEHPLSLVVREPDGKKRSMIPRVLPRDLAGVAIKPDGSGLLLGDGRGIRAISFSSPTLGWFGARGLPNGNLEYSDDGSALLAAGDRIVVLDGKTGAVQKELARGAWAATISADGSTVVATDEKSGVIWDLRSGDVVVSERDGDERLPERLALALMCCGGWVFGPDRSSYVGEREDEHDEPALAVSGDGTRIAIRMPEVADSAQIAVFDTGSKELVATLSARDSIVHDVVLDRSGARAVVASGRFGAWLYHVDTKARFDLGEAWSPSFSRDGKLLVGKDDQGAKVWRVSDGQLLGRFVLSPTNPDEAAFVSADGHVEWLGTPNGVRLICKIGSMELPFEVCADRVVEPGLIARVFGR